ncbi:MAG TPA: serine O-acetyltransferase, partial [Candidatus Hydrogenedentes bacterium]|nr:serine O-acetyltransferase [Candidatus Hydrogenedentota bacterium]
MNLSERDTLWEQIRAEAAEGVWREPMLASFLHSTILNHKTFEDALGFQLAS